MKFLDEATMRARRTATAASSTSSPVDANFEARQKSAFYLAGVVGEWLFAQSSNDELIEADVFETGTWSTSENRHLYYTWRRSHGDTRLIEDAPGHVFLRHEVYEFVTLLHMCFLFGWGLEATSKSLGRFFQVDHDGRGLVSGDGQDVIVNAFAR